MKSSTYEPHGIPVHNTGAQPVEGDPFEVRPTKPPKFLNRQGNVTTNPPSKRRKSPRSELHDHHSRQAHYHKYDPRLHVNQMAEVVPDEEPVDLHGPAGTETAIVYRILCRIDGGEWRHDLVGETGAAATFSSRAELEGHLKWLRSEAAKHPEPKLEYTQIPLFVAARKL